VNPAGSVGFGLHIITVPGGRPVDIDARMSIATLNGPWTDSVGNSGNFTFAARTGGSARPLPALSSSKLVSSGLTTGVTTLPLNTNVVVRTVTLAIPAAGQVMANASGLFDLLTGSGFTQFTWCSISTGVTVETAHYIYTRASGTNVMSNVPFAGTRVFSVTPGPFTVNLVCYASSSLFDFYGTLQTVQLSALFVPD